MAADLQKPIFQDAHEAREYLEELRWPDGPYCPHCGEAEAITHMTGKKHRPGLYQCNSCRKQFTVTVGTVFERSKIPLNKWLLATHLLSASKKGMSAHQLHRMLGVTYKTAWFMAHRIREAMKDGNPGPLGGEGKQVQADETYIGNSPRSKSFRKGHRYKQKIVALVEPEGRSRAFHVQRANAETVREILVTNADRQSHLVTDNSRLYHTVGKEFDKHTRVYHGAGRYVSKDGFTSNNVENFFSVFKRGMRGVYHFCGEQHLQRYLNEFDFRYSTRQLTDAERAAIALSQIEGKRLTYRRTDEAPDA